MYPGNHPYLLFVFQTHTSPHSFNGKLTSFVTPGLRKTLSLLYRNKSRPFPSNLRLRRSAHQLRVSFRTIGPAPGARKRSIYQSREPNPIPSSSDKVRLGRFRRALDAQQPLSLFIRHTRPRQAETSTGTFMGLALQLFRRKEASPMWSNSSGAPFSV